MTSPPPQPMEKLASFVDDLVLAARDHEYQTHFGTISRAHKALDEIERLKAAILNALDLNREGVSDTALSEQLVVMQRRAGADDQRIRRLEGAVQAMAASIRPLLSQGEDYIWRPVDRALKIADEAILDRPSSLNRVSIADETSPAYWRGRYEGMMEALRKTHSPEQLAEMGIV